jgi:hypothetical protein
MSVPIVPNSVACLHFAYITLEVLLYRALLRPLENVDFEEGLETSQTDMQGTNRATTGVAANLNHSENGGDLASLGDSNGELRASFFGQAEAIICAAEKCAIVVTTFTAELMSWSFAGFWYSCMFPC